jgi:molybdopterin-guanine dinucleotide biosynthesis protein A
VIPAGMDGYVIDGIAGVILAGGRNSRFPSQKGFIRIGDVSIIERTLGIMRSMFRNVMISTNMPESYFFLGAQLVGDVLPSRGPMTGLYSALINANEPAVFVAACDMPFVKTGIISLICGKYKDRVQTDGFDAAIPVFDGIPQPLLGIYRDTALPALENAIMDDKVSLQPFLTEVRTFFIEEIDVRAADPDGKSFININTVDDYNMVLMKEGFATGREEGTFSNREHERVIKEESC